MKIKKELKTIDDSLKAIEADLEIKKLIWNSPSFQKEYHPRTQKWVKKPRTESGLACDDFWDSFDGISMRYLLEQKYGVSSYTNAMSAFKIALQVFIHRNWEAIRNGKSETI